MKANPYKKLSDDIVAMTDKVKLNSCTYNVGAKLGQNTPCGAIIKKGYQYCYGHWQRSLKEEDKGYQSAKDWTESTDINF